MKVAMEVRIEKDNLYVDTEMVLVEPYLRRCKTGYTAYWHFVRDFHATYKDCYVPSEEFKTALRNKIVERRKIERLLIDPIDISKYSELFVESEEQYPFQAKAVRYSVHQKRVLLADTVGLGKTIVAISTALWLIEYSKISKVFVVVPASLGYQWLSECRRFINTTMFPDLELVLNNKTPKERHYVYRNFQETDNPIIMMTSYATVLRDQAKIKKLSIDMGILDECSKIKTRSAKTTRAIRKVFKPVEYIMALNAVPIENGLEDLYSPSEILAPYRLHTKAFFEKQYCVMEKVRLWKQKIDIYKVVGYKNVKDAQEKLKGMYIRRTVDEVGLELPDMITQTIELELTDTQKKMYSEISGETFGELTRKDMLGQMIKLHELCDSTELIDPKIKSSSKIEELKRLLTEDYKYSKVILITEYKRFAKIIKRELKKFKPLLITGDTKMGDRQFIVKQFNESGCNVLIGTEAISKGLNLQVASLLFNIDLPWNPAEVEQRRGRFHRIGSKHQTIRMVNFMTKDTIEKKIMDKLYCKGKLFEQMFRQDEGLKIGNLLSMTKDDLDDFMKE